MGGACEPRDPTPHVSRGPSHCCRSFVHDGCCYCCSALAVWVSSAGAGDCRRFTRCRSELLSGWFPAERSVYIAELCQSHCCCFAEWICQRASPAPSSMLQARTATTTPPGLLRPLAPAEPALPLQAPPLPPAWAPGLLLRGALAAALSAATLLLCFFAGAADLGGCAAVPFGCSAASLGAAACQRLSNSAAAAAASNRGGWRRPRGASCGA